MPDPGSNARSSLFIAEKGGVRVRLTPKASRDRIVGIAADAGGSGLLKATVTAAAEGGKANARLIGLLARAWRVPKSSIAFTAGVRERTKTLLVEGDPKDLLDRLEAWAERA